MADEGPDTNAACEPSQHEVIPVELCDAQEEVNFKDYIDGNSSAVVCSALANKVIITHVTDNQPAGNEDDKDEEENVPMVPSATQVTEAIGVVCLLFLSSRKAKMILCITSAFKKAK